MALKIPSEDRIINYWDYTGGEPPEDFDPSNPTIVNADWIMKMMDKIVNGNYATKSFNIVSSVADLPNNAEQGQTAYVLSDTNKSNFWIYDGNLWQNPLDMKQDKLPTLQNGKVLSNDGSFLQWKDINWGDIKSNIYEQEDLFENLTKGIKYDSTIATAIDGYSKRDRVLYNDNGITYYIESLIDNNTTEPSDTSIWNISNLRQVEGVQSATNPLPTASADTLGQIYLNWQSNDSVLVCELNNGTYEWVSEAVTDIFTKYDTIYEKTNKNYYALYEVSTDVWDIYQLGISYWSNYKWINNTIYHNTIPSNKYINLTLGSSGSNYIAPSDGWIWLSKRATALGQYVLIRISKDSTRLYEIENDAIATNNIQIIVPIKKGFTFYIEYSLAGETNAFRFIYAINGRY